MADNDGNSAFGKSQGQLGNHPTEEATDYKAKGNSNAPDEYPTEDNANGMTEHNKPAQQGESEGGRKSSSLHGSKDCAHGAPAAPDSFLRTTCMVYFVLSLISFVFLLTAACPIPWFRGKGTYSGVKWTTWRRTGGELPDERFNDIAGCSKEKHFRQVIATCAVVSAVFSFFNLIAAALCLPGKAGYGKPLMWGFFTVIWSIGGWAMSVALFHDQRCSKEAMASISRLDAGFALTFIAWALMSIAIFLLLRATRQTLGPPPTAPPLRKMSVFFLAILIIALIFLCVGCAFTLWKRSFPDGNIRHVRTVKATMWHTDMIAENGYSTRFGLRRYRCSAYVERIRVCASFTILAIIAVFFAAVFAIVSFVKPAMRIMANVFTIISIIFLFIVWVTAIAVRYSTLCNESTYFSFFKDFPGIPSGIDGGSLSFSGYTVAEGLGLIIAAWCILIVGVIANIVVGEPGQSGGDATVADNKGAGNNAKELNESM